MIPSSDEKVWYIQSFERSTPEDRLLMNAPRYHMGLQESLWSPSATWLLASIMLPIETEDTACPGLTFPTIGSYSWHFVHIEAYIVHLDTSPKNQVAFRLTPRCIIDLILYHKEMCRSNRGIWSFDRLKLQQQANNLHEIFVLAITRFVYFTDASILTELDEDGCSELPGTKSEEVKIMMLNMLQDIQD